MFSVIKNNLPCFLFIGLAACMGIATVPHACAQVINSQVNPAIDVPSNFKTSPEQSPTNLYRNPVVESKPKVDEAVPPTQKTDLNREMTTGGNSAFQVNVIQVRDNTLISDEVIGKVIVPFQNRMLNAEDLTRLVEEINNLYRERGYLTSIAFIEPQDLETGTIVIKILEGQIAKMDLSGNKYTKSSVIEDRIRFKPGDKLNFPELEKELETLNRTEPYRIKAKLTAGDKTGSTDVKFNVEEQQPFQLSATFDNAGRPGIGTYRSGVEFADRNVTGRGDRFFTNYLVGAGQQIASASYSLPVNRYGTTVSGLFGFSHVDVDLSSLGIDSGTKVTGNLYNYGLLLTQPLGWERNWTTDLGFNARHATTFFDDGFADARSSTDVRSLALGLNYDKYDRFGRTFYRTSATFAPKWLGANEDFVKFENYFTRLIRLPNRNLLTLRGYTQLTPNALPAIEQFQLGGINSARGYTQGVLIGDRGYSVSSEWSWPIPYMSAVSPWAANRLRGVLFADYGQIWLDNNNRNFVSAVSNTAKNTSLLSAGVGFRAFFTQYLQGYVDMAFGLLDRSAIEPNAQPTARVHFGLRSDLLSNEYKSRTETITPIKTNVSRPATVSTLLDDSSETLKSVVEETRLEPIQE
jgi:hemolysin activation/secretion protein